MDLNQIDITQVKGIGPARKKQFEKLNIHSVMDLFNHLPRDYRDMTTLSSVENMQKDVFWFGKVTITSKPTVSYIRRNFSITRANAADKTGSIVLIYYNQPYMQDQMQENKTYYVYGKPDLNRGEIQLANPMLEPVSTSAGKRLMPIYSSTQGLSQNMLTKFIEQAYLQFGSEIEDSLPQSIQNQFQLLDTKTAYQFAHFPKSKQERDNALRTLAFEELLLLRAFLSAQKHIGKNAQPALISNAQKQQFLSALPYQLTGAQQQAFAQVESQLNATTPMRLLLQGDVGSGKTVIAFYALYIMAQSGFQGVFMAPTEILASQHYRDAQDFFAPFGIQVALLTSGLKKAEREAILLQVENGEIQIVIGTHAVLSEDLTFKKLSLIITDEQHRFGVKQRAALDAKGEDLHTLVMSATPIPRTLSLIVYGDLDLCVLDEMPKGRLPVETHIVPRNRDADMYQYICMQIAKGHQAFVVCPAIEMEEDATLELVTTTACYDKIKHHFPALSVETMHGQMPKDARSKVMQDFVLGKTSMLISTTVVEVGVNVPNATVMVVEQADRFGLAQLHQLRGRVGRGGGKAYCFLVSDALDNERLQALKRTNDGFAIAQYDLQQRGPGDFLGTDQHGMVGLSVSKLLQDSRTVEEVIAAYDEIFATGTLQEQKALVQQGKKRYQAKTQDIVLN